MRLVLDTNTIVSGLFWKGSPRALLAAACERADVSLYCSPPLLGELTEVPRRKKFSPALSAAKLPARQLLQRYLRVAHVVVPAAISPVVRDDPDDDHVLACALAATADVIVSGDSHLLNLKVYRGIPIVGPAEALKRLPAHRTR